jgi:arylsulfatase A-like enzyme
VTDGRPNFLFIMSDDHAAHAMSCYGSRINATPHLDRIAREGMRLDACLCTNSICSPSRASILTGTYSHVNGVRNLNDGLDGRQTTFPQLLRAVGYQTAIFGKWHLGHGGVNDPTGFDRWCVLPGQGLYHDPEMFDSEASRSAAGEGAAGAGAGEPGGAAGGRERKTFPGYVTDVITDLSLRWLQARDPRRPFCLLVHHKAPHRPWQPDERHATLYEDAEIPTPETFDDDYRNRARAAGAARMTVEHHLGERDVKGTPPEGLTPEARKRWLYQRYIKDYLRCIASIDDNVGRLLDYLDEQDLAQKTVVVYTSDQGFFLGDHGWYDKRFFYEESLRMPFVVRFPPEIRPGSTDARLVLNVDFAPLFLDYAGLPVPEAMQGRSFRPLLRGETPPGWRTAMYYRYFMHCDPSHNIYAHYGVRTEHHKLIYYYETQPDPPEWELFDLLQDPGELRSVYGDPAYADVRHALAAGLHRLRVALGDTTNPWPDEPTGEPVG